MNILILSTHMNSGGITSYIWRLVKILSKAGHQIIVVSSGGNMVEEIRSFGGEHVTLNIRTKSELSPKIYFALPKLVKLIREKNIDIIHSQTRVTQVMGFILGKLTGRPYISTCHGFYKKRLWRRLFPCWGDAVAAISVAVREHLICDFGVSKDKVFLIHHGIDSARFKPAGEEEKRTRRLEFGLKGESVIGIIARLSKEKGHKTLLLAMKKVVEKIPAALLLIIGLGRLEGELKKMTRDLGLDRHVRFFPVINHPAEVLEIFDVSVAPSLEEGFGLSIIESQAAGVPVVASRTGGIVDLIKDTETGLLVEPGDADALSDAVIFLLMNRAKAKEISLAARKFIEEELSIDTMMEKTLALYRFVINKT